MVMAAVSPKMSSVTTIELSPFPPRSSRWEYGYISKYISILTINHNHIQIYKRKSNIGGNTYCAFVLCMIV